MTRRVDLLLRCATIVTVDADRRQEQGTWEFEFAFVPKAA